MLRRIAHLAIAAPRRIVAIAVLVMVACAIFGIPVAKSLSAGGFQDPTSESAQATRLLVDKFGQGDMDLVISVTAEAGAQSDIARAVGTDIAGQLQSADHVADVTSAWTAPPPVAPALISKDGKTGLIVAGITGGESDAQKHAKALTDRLVHDRDGVTVRAGGEAMIYVQINGQSEKDLLMMESIAIPLSFVVLVWVFGGLLAAALPLAVGLFAILGSMAVLRAVTLVTDVSIFALNLTVAMGLALAIDYTLLIISRYRDELADGADREQALVRTMQTAGRTVLFSAMTVALSMVAMVLFPMYFLKSFAYAGIAVVAFAAVAAIVVAPAAIVAARRPAGFARRASAGPPAPRPARAGAHARSSRRSGIARRNSLCAGRFRSDSRSSRCCCCSARRSSASSGASPTTVCCPQSASARQVGDDLRTDFAVDSATNVDRRHPGRDRRDARRPRPLRRASCRRSPDVSAVSAPGGTFVDGAPTGPPSAPTGFEDGSAFLTVGSTAPLFSDASEAQLDRLHAVSTPGGQPVQMTGVAQINRDSSRGDHLPAAAGPRRDRRDHVRAAVPAHRQRGAAAESVGAQRLVVDRGVRRAGVDLPGRPSRRAGHHADRNPGRQHAGAVVLHRVRAVDGLRGVPGIADPRVLAEVRQDAGRQRRKRRAGPGPHRPRRHRRSAADVDLVRRADRRAGGVHADVRRRPDPGGARGRDPGPHAAGAGVHARAGPVELVGAQAAGPAARAHRHQRIG